MRFHFDWSIIRRLGGSTIRQDVDSELQFHLQSYTQELVGRGWSLVAARAEAERRFGNLTTIRRDCVTIDERRARRRHRRERLADFLHDLRLATRALNRSKSFSLTVVTLVALGVGATTAMLTAVRGILLRPLPFPNGDRLVMVYAQNPVLQIRGSNISYPDYLSWQRDSRAFKELGIWTWTSHALSGEGGAAERVSGAALNPAGYRALAVAPMLGRGLASEDERSRVVLIGADLWRRRYGGDSSLVGRTITMDAESYQVIGIMPKAFRFPNDEQLWVPFQGDANDDRGNRSYAAAVGRLADGVDFAAAANELATVSARLAKDHPVDNQDWAAQLLPLQEDYVGSLRLPLMVLLAAVGGVLLIAGANVAVLMLARGSAREREVAVRVAIGAGRGRVIRQVLAEAVVLFATGGAGGIGVAYLAVRLLRLGFPNTLPEYASFAIGGPSVMVALGLALGCIVVFGLIPSTQAARIDAGSALRGGRTIGVSRRTTRGRSLLVVAQVALSAILLVGAGLLIRSYRALATIDLGFRQQGIISIRLALPDAKYGTPERRGIFWEALRARVAAVPGIATVGTARGIPFSGWNVSGELAIEGHPPTVAGGRYAHNQTVSPDFFRTIGVPLVRGRPFAPTDRDTTAPVAIINETLVRTEFGAEDPIGRRLRFGGEDSRGRWVTVVGVVGDFRHYRLPAPVGPAVYSPEAADPPGQTTLVIRVDRGEPSAVIPAVRAVVAGLDADVPIFQIRRFDELVDRVLWSERMQGRVLTVFASIALGLAAVGLFGVVSYGVSQRRRELGIRSALGATRTAVVRLVVGQGTRLALIGVAIGMAAAIGLARLIGKLLYGVTPADPVTLLTVPAALLGVAVLASLLPARRAAAIEPMTVVREE